MVKTREQKRAEWRAYNASHQEKRKEYSDKYRIEHHEELKARARSRYHAHPEIMQSYQKKYRSAHIKAIKIYQKNYRRIHREEIANKRKKHYADNIDEERLKARQQYHANHERVLSVRKKYYATHRSEIAAKRRKYNSTHKENISKYGKKARGIIRMKVIYHYGAQCKCCGETEIKFLAIDHINGGGGKHREEIGVSSAGFYRWIIKNNYPPEFQVLCHNCNMAKGFYGECPHETLRKNEKKVV